MHSFDSRALMKRFTVLARAFIGGRRFLAKIMHAAMNVGMFLFEVHAAAFDYHLRHLRGSCIVKIDQRLAVHGLTQHGKVRANALDIPGTVLAGLFQ